MCVELRDILLNKAHGYFGMYYMWDGKQVKQTNKQTNGPAGLQNNKEAWSSLDA